MTADRRLIAAGALATTALAAGAVVVLGGSGTNVPSRGSQAPATATIRQQDLVERESVDGTLG